MKNRNIKNILISSMSAAFLIFVSSCAGFNKTHPQEGSYLLSGKISLAAESGAIPALLDTLINNAGNSTVDSSARTATSTFIQTTNEIARDFTVTATRTIAETGEIITKTCVVETSDDGEMTYSIKLPYTGSWTLEARLFGYIDDDPATTEDESTTDSIAYLDGQTTINITEEASSLTKNIIVSPVFTSNTKGQVNLPVYDETGSVDSIKIFEYETDSDGREVKAATPSLDTTFRNSPDYIQGEYEPGSYKIAIYFYDSEGKELYFCRETMVVYSGFVTDTWYGNAPHLDFDSESEKYNFVLTDSLIQSREKRGDSAIIMTEDGLDTPYILWSNTTDEGSLDGGISQKEGFQVFSDIDETTTINIPIKKLDVSSPDFCFGEDGYIYFITSDGIKVCKEAYYSGYLLKETISFANMDSTLSGSNLSISFADGPAYYNNSLYFYLSVYNSDNYSTKQYFCKFDLANRTLNRTELSEFLYDGDNYSLKGCLAVKKTTDTDTDDWILYSHAESSSYGGTNLLVKWPFTINGDTITLASSTDGVEYFELSAANYGVNRALNVSDMQIKDDVLYVLTNYYGVSDSLNISTGGILRFNLNETSFTPSDWSDGIRILGLYTKDSGNTVVQPPLEQADKYFYGPQKFIAIKPKELVIADDGAYIYSDTVASKNRVVKVSLAEESLGEMSVTDVNVTYTKSLSSCSGVYSIH